MTEISDVSLKEYLEALLVARHQYFESRISDLHARLIVMNEIREQLSDQNTDFTGRIALYLPRDEYGARHDAIMHEIRRVESLLATYGTLETSKNLDNKLDALIEWRANLTGRLWAMAGVFAVGNILLILLRGHFSAS